MKPVTADGALLIINTALHRAAGLQAPVCDAMLTQASFPPKMADLELPALLRLIRFLGSIQERGKLRSKQTGLARTDLTAAIKISTEAAAILAEWPRSFRRMLRRIVPRNIDNAADLNLQEVFGNFYRHLYAVLPREQFGFLHDAFEEFASEDWKGLIRGQHRLFSLSMRRNSQWIPAQEAETAFHLHSTRLCALVRRGDLEGMFVQVGHRTECWIRRVALSSWVANREAELAQYMPRPEAKRVLGLKHDTILRVAESGLIRYVNGSTKSFRSKCIYFLREDVLKIKGAFDHHGVPTLRYSRPDRIIALHDALRNYLGRDKGLAAAVRAVIDGALKPVGYTKQFRGLLGYLFRAEELQRYRPIRADTAPEGFLSFKGAARVLNTRPEVIRGLTKQGILSVLDGYRNGFSKLVPAHEVRQFAEKYVDAFSLAELSGETVHRVKGFLRQHRVRLLEIPIHEKASKVFVPRKVAATMQIPARLSRSRESRSTIRMRNKLTGAPAPRFAGQTQ